MKQRAVALAACSVIVVTIVVSVFLGTRHVAVEASSLPSPLLGRAAPAVSATSLFGVTSSLAQRRGHVVVLTFWASWCAPCVAEAAELSSFAWEQQRLHGAEVVGVVFNDSLSQARAFEQHYGSLYPSWRDPDGTIANAFGVTNPPTTFIIDRHGVLVASLVGAVSDRQLTTLVDKVTT